MDITINQQAFQLAEPATLVEALNAFGAEPPYAVALNGAFVARGRHAEQPLRAGDRIEVVRPVAGG
jgi:sulfur carrier protein